jgi:NADPH2:quinone reductase
MKAIQVDKFITNYNELQVLNIKEPFISHKDNVIIQVKAIGLNFFDALMVKGQYQTKPPFPFIPGAEVTFIP